jgi:hypothetical protein
MTSLRIRLRLELCHAHHIILGVPCDDVNGREWNQNDGDELTLSSRHLHTVLLFISYDVPAQQGVLSVNEHHPEYAYQVCPLQTLPALYVGFTLLAAGLSSSFPAYLGLKYSRGSTLWQKCALHFKAYTFPFYSFRTRLCACDPLQLPLVHMLQIFISDMAD